jgi:hypothetical protein
MFLRSKHRQSCLYSSVFVNRATARFILRTGRAGSKGSRYDPPFSPANFPNPRIFVLA